MTTKLYHCTDYSSLCNILKSKAFWPSYCLEKADYLKDPQDFAFAMVCFADLMNDEIKNHLDKFNKNCYIQMSKTWARRNGISNVIYYGRSTVLSSAFRLMLDQIITRHQGYEGDMPDDVRFSSLLMAFFKQYEGYYWNDNKGEWSDTKSQFYTEREWRYIPLVKNNEAFYLDPSEFLNKDFRNEKRQELIKHGYTLPFGWQDIQTIGIPSFAKIIHISEFLQETFSISQKAALAKIRISTPTNWFERRYNNRLNKVCKLS